LVVWQKADGITFFGRKNSISISPIRAALSIYFSLTSQAVSLAMLRNIKGSRQLRLASNPSLIFAAMTEVAFAQAFLATLDKRPARLTADHVEDPKTYPARPAVSCPCPSSAI
jgi:hypothetical protein